MERYFWFCLSKFPKSSERSPQLTAGEKSRGSGPLQAHGGLALPLLEGWTHNEESPNLWSTGNFRPSMFMQFYRMKIPIPNPATFYTLDSPWRLKCRLG